MRTGSQTTVNTAVEPAMMTTHVWSGAKCFPLSALFDSTKVDAVTASKWSSKGPQPCSQWAMILVSPDLHSDSSSRHGEDGVQREL
jgi:hypothetical protein